jgi:hypothetical protein
MSLNVYLDLDEPQPVADEPSIFVREDGQTMRLSRAEWDARYPGREPITVMAETDSTRVYSANITHNLGRMADAAGLYSYLWRPDEHGIATAQHLIEPLREGLARLQANPATYAPLNPANGWGTYEGLVRFVEQYLHACEQYPQAHVSVSR